MARKRLSQALFVYMNGVEVGSLIQQTSGNLQFTYAAIWLDAKESRPISLSLPLTEVPYKGDVVYHFFDNLLPDNDSIRRRIQARFGINTNKCFDLLSYIGKDCVGALQLLTAPQTDTTKKIEGTPLTDIKISALLKNYQAAPLGMMEGSDFRISIAGAQEKTALLWQNNQWYLPEGVTPTTHIIKLPIGKIQHSNIDLSESIENEWLCLQILSHFQLPVNKATITHFEKVKTLVVERFDRQWKDQKTLIRLPQEDMCQALGISSALKYESDGGPGMAQIMKLLEGGISPIQDRERFMKTTFLFWVLGAIDGHAKNFSIKIQAGGRFALTPIYDVMSAYPIAAKRELEWQDLKMAMALKSKNPHYAWDKIQIRHWLNMANYCQFPKETMKNIIDDVFDNMTQIIDTVSNTLPKNFPTQISTEIFKGMLKVKNKN